jgi:hypothetical protein
MALNGNDAARRAEAFSEKGDALAKDGREYVVRLSAGKSEPGVTGRIARFLSTKKAMTAALILVGCAVAALAPAQAQAQSFPDASYRQVGAPVPPHSGNIIIKSPVADGAAAVAREDAAGKPLARGAIPPYVPPEGQAGARPTPGPWGANGTIPPYVPPEGQAGARPAPGPWGANGTVPPYVPSAGTRAQNEPGAWGVNGSVPPHEEKVRILPKSAQAIEERLPEPTPMVAAQTTERDREVAILERVLGSIDSAAVPTLEKRVRGALAALKDPIAARSPVLSPKERAKEAALLDDVVASNAIPRSLAPKIEFMADLHHDAIQSAAKSKTTRKGTDDKER